MENEEVVNPFPSPPVHYLRYTKANLELLKTLRERSGTVVHETIPVADQQELLHDQPSLPEWDLTALERPRADWIVEEGGYEAFGDTWPIPERHPTLEEGGIEQLYPKIADQDYRPALQKLLHTLLFTYHSVLGSLLVPPYAKPPDQPEWKYEWERQIDWIKIVAINMISAVNELRPVQARETLDLTLRSQLANRRQETKAIHAKCDALSEKLAQLRQLAQKATTADPDHMAVDTQQKLKGDVARGELVQVTLEDISRWAEEVV